MPELLHCILQDTIHSLLDDITPSQSKVLDAVIDGEFLPELHQCLLSVFLSWSNRLEKGPPHVVGLKSNGMLFTKEYFYCIQYCSAKFL
jgi:hypothetical protein